MWVDSNLLSLAQDDTALPGNGRRIQHGVHEDVSNDVHTLRYLVPSTAGIVGSHLTGCVGIQVRAHVLNLHLDVSQGSSLQRASNSLLN